MEIIDQLHIWTGLSTEFLGKLILSIAIVTGMLGLRLLVVTALTQRLQDIKRRYYIRRIADYMVWAVIILALIYIWLLESAPQLATFLGLVSAGLAVAMHDTISNLTGWLFILLRKPIQVGDRIEIEGVVGDVIDVRLFQFSIIEVGGHRLAGGEQSTGRIVHIPNGKVLRSQVTNYETGFAYVWDEVPILITFESDWRSAKEVLRTIINRHVEQFSGAAEREIREAAKTYMIYTGKLTPIVYTSIEDSGVKLTMRYIVRPRQIRGVRQAVYEDILEEFDRAENINLAYPTMRYFRASEQQMLGSSHSREQK